VEGFAETIDLFDRYYRSMDALNAAGFHRNLAAEFRERLQQLDWLLAQVRKLDSRADQALERPSQAFKEHVERIQREGLDYEAEPVPEDVRMSPGEARALSDAEFQLKLYTEAFYYLAGRARAIARHQERPLPGLQGFEAEGVRNVRNHLIEHPESRDSRVFIASWGRGGPQGPVLKSIRYSGQEATWPDRGLYRNAVEFRDRLTAALEGAIARSASNER